LQKILERNWKRRLLPLTTVHGAGAGDKNLVDRLQRRDPRALAELYDRYGGALYARILQATGKRRTAEDLVEETFLRAWNRIHSFDSEGGPIEPWLLAIARETAPEWSDEGSTTPPSPKLRRRILASAGHEPFGWAPFLAGAALLTLSAAVYFGGRERTFAIEVLNLREQLGRQNVMLTRVNEALSILNAPGTSELSFAVGSARGKVFVNPQQGVLLIASNLTPAPQGKVYEMWLLPKNGRPVPAGLIEPPPNGTVLHVDHEPVDAASLAAVGVTIENQGGASQPGSPPFLTVPLR
jgi:hypothetical protein